MAEPPFAEALSKFRDLAGLSQDQLAARVNASPASVSRWSCGHTLPKRRAAEALDAALGAEGQLFAAWRAQTSGSTLPEWAQTLSDIEQAAVTLHVVSLVLVPGYLQSPLYAEAVFRAGWPLASDEEIARLVRLRTERLSQLPKMKVTAVFPITALTSVDEVVRKEQAAQLVSLVEAGRVAIHLIPEGSILLEPASTLLSFRLHSGDLVMSSDHADGNVIHGPDTHQRLSALIVEAAAAALPARLSLEALKDLA